MDFALAGVARCVANAQLEDVGVFCEEFLHKRALFINLDDTFPTPEQPLKTNGLYLMVSFW